MSHHDGPDPDDVSSNHVAGPSFDDVVRRRASRRTVLGGGLATAATFVTARSLGGDLPAAAAARRTPRGAAGLLGFDPVRLAFDDEVHVPAGYTGRVFVPWGTPITGSHPAFEPGGNSADEQAQQVGMNHDGMQFFPIDGASDHGVLVINHEYTNEEYLHDGSGSAPAHESYTPEMVARSLAAHGLSVIEVRRDADGAWEVVKSATNRRITGSTPMAISGPAAGHRLLRTAADSTGKTVLGTLNNCSNGQTPWGTILVSEENFNGYFNREAGVFSDEDRALLDRYNVGPAGYGWHHADDRFKVTPEDANEPNRFGWIVEFDPYDPMSRPVKRTALGRVKHESAEVAVGSGDRAVVYGGDDQRGEFIYKFVSDESWRAARGRGRSPLDRGVLYTAKFNDDGTGEWLPLVHGRNGLTAENGFADQGDVLVKTRMAASIVGATKMDRPEWVTIDRNTSQVYCTLTNNTDPSTREPSEVNPRAYNKWGHIVRWQEKRDDFAATTFEWDLFLLAGQGRDSGDGSTIDAADAFGSPDGIGADADGRVWIQTDGSQPQGANDQMLAANPYVTDAHGTPEIKRFLTGPRDCEVTGLTWTPDRRTMFVNIQHPGGTWPHTHAAPRSATCIITKDDGGVIGT